MARVLRQLRRVITVRREHQIRRFASCFIPVRHRCRADNVYHCCVWKTASQWIRNVFSATAVYRYSGLLPFHYDSTRPEGIDTRDIRDRQFAEAFPLRRIVSPLYVNFEHFAAIPKPQSYRAFFVCRDPRDIVVSHYFSTRYSHVPNPGVSEMRAQLEGKTDQEGMLWQLDYMEKSGIFDALRSWAWHIEEDPKLLLVRFEELVGDRKQDAFEQLFHFCDIPLPARHLTRILDRLSFERLSGGRKQGEVDPKHKYRSGKPGDWRQHFDREVTSAFREKAGDLVAALGYKSPDSQVAEI